MIYDAARMALWVRSSKNWMQVGRQFIGLDIQMLGHGEAPLLGFEGVSAELTVHGIQNEDGMLIRMQCYALSTYWIFGLYEVLRKMKIALGDDFVKFSDLYHDVSVIRMPLAKHEVKGAPGFREVWHYPVNVVESASGRTGWRVFDPKKGAMAEIFRKDLADRFLIAEEELQH